VITLTLLAMLVLVVFALGTLVRVDGQVSAASAAQTKARQHALLGLNLALSELRTNAGIANNVTAMAGITGLGASAANSTRHWCGVWNSSGTFVTWLCSGASNAIPPPVPAANAVVLVDSGSVGAATSNSEHVLATKIPIAVPEVPGRPATTTTVGRYAYWIGDEGVKISAYASGAAFNFVFPSAPSALSTLGGAASGYAPKLPAVISYEQLKLLPTPGAALAASVMNDSFHHVTLTSMNLVSPGVLNAGSINLNTNSAYVWRSICETYNVRQPGAPIPAANLTATINSIANNIAASSSGKSAFGPFTSVSAFGSSTLLANALSGTGVTPAQFMSAMAPMLGARSDTFRIRAYGEAVSPFDAAKIEATAYCEAIVQPNPNALGQRYIVSYFRWLGPADI